MEPNGGKKHTRTSQGPHGEQLTDLLRLVEALALPKIQYGCTVLEADNENQHVTKSQGNGSFARGIEDILTPFPDEGDGVEGFSKAISVLSTNSMNTSSPRALGKLVSGPSPPGIAADLFLSIFNNNGHVWRTSPAISAIEKHTSLELCKLFGLNGPHAGGITVPGGAAANMLAMLVARSIISPQTKKEGGGLTKHACFVSDSAHYSLSNAAQIVGLGTDSIITVPTNVDGTMNVQSLETLVQDAINKGKTPLMIAATSGNTVDGVFDPLGKIGAIAARANAWFHVDACWGGAVAFSSKLRHLIAGSELADSISFNPHKMLGVPLVCAFLLAKDLRTFWLANKIKAGYLFHNDANENESSIKVKVSAPVNQAKDQDGRFYNWKNSDELIKTPPVTEIRDLASLTVQCSRRSDATKLFLHWTYYGTNGIAREVEQAVDSARHLAYLVDANPRLELLLQPKNVFAQVCFYWKPKLGGSTTSDSAFINSWNTQLIYDHLAKHEWYIDHAPDDTRGEFLRVACTRQTTRETVEALVSKLEEVALSLDL